MATFVLPLAKLSKYIVVFIADYYSSIFDHLGLLLVKITPYLSRDVFEKFTGSSSFDLSFSNRDC